MYSTTIIFVNITKCIFPNYKIYLSSQDQQSMPRHRYSLISRITNSLTIDFQNETNPITLQKFVMFSTSELPDRTLEEDEEALHPSSSNNINSFRVVSERLFKVSDFLVRFHLGQRKNTSLTIITVPSLHIN